MGSGAGEYDESPAHLVEISRPFLLGKHEVTQEQWVAVMGDYPSKWSGKAGLPVESVSWVDCQEFIRRLNERSGMQFRLPTEAEWEYACRAGTTGEWAGEIERMGWYRGNSGEPRKQNRKFETATASDRARMSDAEWDEYFLWLEPNNRTHVVMQKEPNDWGLFDMHGNVWEWCSDWYDAGYYRGSPGADPRGPAVGSNRVFRGGSCDERESACRSAYRGSNPSYGATIGFRLARSL